MVDQLQLGRAAFGLRTEIPRRLGASVPLAATITMGKFAGLSSANLGSDPPIEVGPPPAALPPVSGDTPMPGGMISDGGIPAPGGGVLEPPPGGGMISDGGIPAPAPGGSGVSDGGIPAPSGGGGSAPAPGPPPAPLPGSCGCGGGRVIGSRAVNFHFTQATSGGTAASEMRVFGPIANPFRIKEVVVSPTLPGAPGQYVDVLVSPDGDTSDTVTPTGQSIFSQVVTPQGLTAPDADVGVGVPQSDLSIQHGLGVFSAGWFVKCRAYFLSPASAMPILHVLVIIEEVDMSAIDVTPRPGPLPPVVSAPPSTSAPGPTGSPAPGGTGSPPGSYVPPLGGVNYYACYTCVTAVAGLQGGAPANDYARTAMFTPRNCLVNGYWVACEGQQPISV